MRATIKMIAERAGVSIGTVDRVLHDRPYVKEEVRRMLPAHLEADFEIGTLTWDIFDAADLTWTGFEAKDATWNQLDLDGAGILEGDH